MERGGALAELLRKLVYQVLALGGVLLAFLYASSLRLQDLLRRRHLQDLDGRVVLVTSAGRALGRAIAQEFAINGCVVVCVDADQRSNDETAARINLLQEATSEARAYTCDVTSCTQVRRLAADVLSDLGHVDVLVNCSPEASSSSSTQAQHSIKAQHAVDEISVGLLSHLWMILAFLPGMISRDSGHVVAILSVTECVGFTHKEPYTASKFAVTGLMDAVKESLRLQGQHVKVTCIHPYLLSLQSDLHQELQRWVPELSAAGAAAEVVRAVKADLPYVALPRKPLFWMDVLRNLRN